MKTRDGKEDYGSLNIKLASLLEKMDYSKNEFCQACKIQHSQLTKYLNGTITRIDTEVLVRMCATLHCTSINDLIEYVPPESKRKKKEDS